MPKQLPEQEQWRIYEAYKELQSKKDVAEELGYSQATVKKYVEKCKERERQLEKEKSDAEINFENMFSTPIEAEKDVNFGEMGPGEFIEWYFKDELREIRVESIGLFSRRCRGQHALPTKEKMQKLLSEMPTSIGNKEQIRWIAEEYWRFAVQYLSVKLAMPEEEIRQKVATRNADWVNLSWSSTSGMQDQGNMSSVGFGTNQNNQNQQDTAFNPQNQQNQGGGAIGPTDLRQDDMMQQTQQNGADQQTMMMMQMMKQIQEGQKQMVKALQQNQNQDSSDDLRNKLEEIAEAKRHFEALTDDSSGEMEKVVKLFQRELSNIKDQVDDGTSVPGNDPATAALVNMSEREDVEPDTLLTFATKLAADSDPEVKKKKIEKDIEMKKMENRQDMISGLLEGVEEMVEKSADLGELLQGANGMQADQQMGFQDNMAQGMGAPQQQPQQQPQQPTQQPTQQPQQPQREPQQQTQPQQEDQGFNIADYEPDEEPEETEEPIDVEKSDYGHEEEIEPEPGQTSREFTDEDEENLRDFINEMDETPGEKMADVEEETVDNDSEEDEDDVEEETIEEQEDVTEETTGEDTDDNTSTNSNDPVVLEPSENNNVVIEDIEQAVKDEKESEDKEDIKEENDEEDVTEPEETTETPDEDEEPDEPEIIIEDDEPQIEKINEEKISKDETAREAAERIIDEYDVHSHQFMKLRHEMHDEGWDYGTISSVWSELRDEGYVPEKSEKEEEKIEADGGNVNNEDE